MTETNLLPCPFCGGEAKHVSLSGLLHGVECRSCAWSVLPVLASEEDAARVWNTRAERTCRYVKDPDTGYELCSECGAPAIEDWTADYCWSCGAKVAK